MRNALLYLLVFAFAIGCKNNSEPKTDTDTELSNRNLIGVWEWVGYSYSDEDTSFQWTNVDGLFLITEKYYSIISVFSAVPREISPDAEIDDVIEGLEENLGVVTSNAGTYEIDSDTIRLYRNVALGPEIIASGYQPWKLKLPIWKDNNTIVWKSGNREFTYKRVE